MSSNYPEKCHVAGCVCGYFNAKQPSESSATPERDAGFLVPEAKNVFTGQESPGMTTCRACQGSGAGEGLAGICPYCGGSGQVETYEARQQRLGRERSTPVTKTAFGHHLDTCGVCASVAEQFPDLELFDHQLCLQGRQLFRNPSQPVVTAPTFTEEWESAPRWATRTTEQIAAEYWFLRGGHAKEVELTGVYQ